jgi:hypothetical protein
VIPLQESYATLVRQLQLDTIILVDGGTDSLMRGDEVSLGTPHEDVASIIAVNEVDVAHKLLVCLGFGIDRHHGICHADFLEAVAALIRANGYLGLFSLLPTMPEVQQYQAAVEAVFQAMPRMESIVSSSILAALVGNMGTIIAPHEPRAAPCGLIRSWPCTGVFSSHPWQTVCCMARR